MPQRALSSPIWRPSVTTRGVPLLRKQDYTAHKRSRVVQDAPDLRPAPFQLLLQVQNRCRKLERESKWRRWQWQTQTLHKRPHKESNLIRSSAFFLNDRRDHPRRASSTPLNHDEPTKGGGLAQSHLTLLAHAESKSYLTN